MRLMRSSSSASTSSHAHSRPGTGFPSTRAVVLASGLWLSTSASMSRSAAWETVPGRERDVGEVWSGS